MQAKYEEIYSENQNLRAQLQQAQKLADAKPACDIPPDRMEAIASALVSAQAEAQRIVNAAREKAWQIITDAKKGLPVAGDSAKPALPMNLVKKDKPVASQLQKPAVAPKKSTMEDIDELIKSILSKTKPGGD